MLVGDRELIGMDEVSEGLCRFLLLSQAGTTVPSCALRWPGTLLLTSSSCVHSSSSLACMSLRLDP